MYVVTLTMPSFLFISNVNVNSVWASVSGFFYCQRHHLYVVTVTIVAFLLISNVNVTSVWTVFDFFSIVNVNKCTW